MPQLWRRRRNRSTKLNLFVRIGILALTIDLFGSLYLWIRGADDGVAEQRSPVSSIAIRLGLYLLIFVAVVGLADQVAAWQAGCTPPSTAPPPLYGRV